MCNFAGPKITTPTVHRLAAPTSDAGQRQADFERLLRRSRGGSAADMLTTPLGLVGGAAQ